ncbi:PAS domain S-box-containing protein/diguanylate cyclase (GGDEF) domain-containing protein [Marinobacter antarcticus]|uniref:PAS domain S-box-containing protein/diguanylate cyclase (GGDEF) domain-containing protein n=2 Tax=Marinobacter antarcticus TaxID=564117 RepID=A0A1M6RBH1_9GAMM|nr:PAS domain S-box-containing protein/diguanylate cyclase (GGDEF) domain-containing protein [Marinobacter antarcticus]
MIEGEQFIKTIIDSAPNMMGYWGTDLRCRYANNAFSEWFGIQPEKIIGIRFQDLVSEQLFALNEPHIRGALAGEPQRFERTLNKADGSVGHIIGHYIPDFGADGKVRGFSIQASEVTVLKGIEANGRWYGEVWNRRKDEELYLQRMTISMVRDDDGEPMRYVSVFSDITALWRRDEYIRHLAFHDALTDLPNRTLLMDRIDQKRLHGEREQSHFALMFLDLDGFKRINDQFGHKYAAKSLGTNNISFFSTASQAS